MVVSILRWLVCFSSCPQHNCVVDSCHKSAISSMLGGHNMSFTLHHHHQCICEACWYHNRTISPLKPFTHNPLFDLHCEIHYLPVRKIYKRFLSFGWQNTYKVNVGRLCCDFYWSSSPLGDFQFSVNLFFFIMPDAIWLLQLVISSPLIHALGDLSQAPTGIRIQIPRLRGGWLTNCAIPPRFLLL